MAHKWDPDAMRWIPYEQPFSRPRPRQVNRHMLLRSLAEEVVYEDSVAQRYAGLLAAVICDGNSTAKRGYEHMLARERQKAKSLVRNQAMSLSAAFTAQRLVRGGADASYALNFSCPHTAPKSSGII